MDSNFFGGLDEDPQIDLTQLIDCMFMLIIFFVLTMSFSKPVLEVMLPQAAHGEVSRERNDLLLSVKKDGSLWLGSESTTLEGLSAALDAAPERTLNIYMDREAPFAKFVEVMDLAKVKREGRFVISTDPEPAASADTVAASETTRGTVHE